MSRVAALQSSDSAPKLPTRAWHDSIPNPLPSSSFVEDAGPGLTMLTDSRISAWYEVPLFHPSVWICQRCNSAYPPHALKEIGTYSQLAEVDLEHEGVDTVTCPCCQ
eukprot:6888883-Karenia_brevis.AAC.1